MADQAIIKFQAIAGLANVLPKSLFTYLGLVPPTENVPARVFRVIEAFEERSERLIGYAQLGIVATFSTLYLVSKKPTDAGTGMVEAVPYFLAAYLIFTLARIGLSHIRYLPGWLLVFSMLADVALLMGLIWTFHVQYAQPAAFYLKVPTFMYIFMFISLRALRFDERFVLSVGLFAAAGWVLMVLYAYLAAGASGVTREFVPYLTQNLILFGAEFDKVSTILVVTGILYFAIRRARKVLISAIKEGTATQDMRRFLSDGVAEAITNSEEIIEAGSAEERQAAILMLDIRGFTNFSTDRSPQEVVSMLISFHARIVPIIRSHNGVVDKFLGDGVMATFGAVRPSETATADALRATEAVMREADEWREEMVKGRKSGPLDVNAAVTSGPIVFAALGQSERLEYTVIGQAVNLSAKLEKHNKVERTHALTNRETYENAIAQGYEPILEHRRIRDCSIAGIGEHVDLAVLKE